jgi:hypothetical protein
MTVSYGEESRLVSLKGQSTPPERLVLHRNDVHVGRRAVKVNLGGDGLRPLARQK